MTPTKKKGPVKKPAGKRVHKTAISFRPELVRAIREERGIRSINVSECAAEGVWAEIYRRRTERGVINE